MGNTAGVQASIGNGQTLNADAARYWLALVAVIYRLHGIVIDPTEGTRTKERQGYLYANRNRPGFNPAWPADSPFAYHVSGRAVDVGSGVGYLATIASQVFYAVAGLYGFRPTVKGEPWHFEWRAEWVGISLEVATVMQRIIPANPTTTKGDTMIHLKGSGKRGEALIGPGYYHSLTGEEAKYVSLVADREVDCRNNDRLFDLLATAASAPSKRP